MELALSSATDASAPESVLPSVVTSMELALSSATDASASFKFGDVASIEVSVGGGEDASALGCGGGSPCASRTSRSAGSSPLPSIDVPPSQCADKTDSVAKTPQTNRFALFHALAITV